MRRALPLVALAVTCALGSGPAAAEPPDLTLFVGTAHGGDAQLHPGLRHLQCSDCPDFAAAPAPGVGEPSLLSLAISAIGRAGPIRGGGELFGIVSATEGVSGYAGALTFVGAEVHRVFATAGFGLGSYVGSAHSDRFSAVAGNIRGEVGVRLTRRWTASLRADLLENNISRSQVVSLGLGFAP